MTWLARSRWQWALVGLGLVVAGCNEAVVSRDFVATVAALDGEYELRTYAEGWGGEAHYLTVELVASDDLWDRRRLCPVWTGVTLTANGRPMELRQDGGTGHLGHDYCGIGFFVLPVDPSEWVGEPEVRFRLEDATGNDEIVFQNFVVAPRVILESPESGILHVGDRFVLRFEPSVYVLPSINVTQGTFGSGITWAQGYPDDIKLDDQHVAFTVPSNAHVPSTEALHFYSGSGWWAPVVDCSAVTFCFGQRSACPDNGCASPYGIHFTQLDDYTVTVPISVEP